MVTSAKYRIGVDVGGTNTDAVVLELGKADAANRGVLAWKKVVTTENVTDGIETCLRQVIQVSGVNTTDIVSVTIGTTHFINAVVERDTSRLSRVAVLRFGAPYTKLCPPFIDFPPSLARIMNGHIAFLDGGLEVDGKEISPIQKSQVLAETEIIRAKGIRNLVLVGIFSPLAQDDAQEYYARNLIEEKYGKGAFNIVCSRDIGPVGILERENAAILNASILTFARRTISQYQEVVRRLKITCPLFLTQHDGTMISAARATLIPVRTFANGPTNSMRGASYLSGPSQHREGKSVMVMDVGGTTSDVGVLMASGFPRQAAAVSEVGGVRMNMPMPDILSIGLGGGSKIRFRGLQASVGPDSVGNTLDKNALIFGGKILTASDVAVACGFETELGDPSLVSGALSDTQKTAAADEIRLLLEGVIDKMKLTAEDVVLILVGGGSIIVPPGLRGVSEAVRPPFFSVANAVGAAIAMVSAEVDRIESLVGRSQSQVMEHCKQEAIEGAVSAGAERDTVRIADFSSQRLAYVEHDIARITVRAVGHLSIQRIRDMVETMPDDSIRQPDNESNDQVQTQMTTKGGDDDPALSRSVDATNYRPAVSASGVWTVNEVDLEWLADGCAVLGCGGGGDPYPEFLMAREALRSGKSIKVVDEAFLKGDASILRVCFMGSPSHVLRYCGVSEVHAVISEEIGGGNGIRPMLFSAVSKQGYPVVDGDFMGRAYPRMDQVTSVACNPNARLTPVAIADGIGNCALLPSTRFTASVETILRSVCTQLGSKTAVVHAPMSIQDFRKYGITRSVSQAWWLGRALAIARQTKTLLDLPSTILAVQNGVCLFVGKIVDVVRDVQGGFTLGQVTIAPLREEEMDITPTSAPSMAEDDRLVIPFQNENLCAYLDANGGRTVKCTVPDLIIVLDSQSGSAIGTQDYRYGLRVTVMGLAGSPKWTTPAGLSLGGPAAFAINSEYNPVGDYKEPRSVIEEYRARE